MDWDVRELSAPTRHPAAFDELCTILGPHWASTRSVYRIAYSHDAWSFAAKLYYEIRHAMEPYCYKVMGHTSHVYPQGGNLYMIFFAETDSPDLEKIG